MLYFDKNHCVAFQKYNGKRREKQNQISQYVEKYEKSYVVLRRDTAGKNIVFPALVNFEILCHIDSITCFLSGFCKENVQNTHLSVYFTIVCLFVSVGFSYIHQKLAF